MQFIVNSRSATVTFDENAETVIAVAPHSGRTRTVRPVRGTCTWPANGDASDARWSLWGPSVTATGESATHFEVKIGKGAYGPDMPAWLREVTAEVVR